MPEFRPLLKDRDTWLASSGYFSFQFIEFLQRIKPGWYLNTHNWSHRFYLKIDEESLNVSLHHFLVDCSRGRYEPSASCDFFRASLEHTERLFMNFLEDYKFLRDEDMSTYYLKPYGIIMIDHVTSDNFHTLRFYNWAEYSLQINKSKLLKNPKSVSNSSCHFRVTLISQRQLVVECLFRGTRCVCEKRIQILSPFKWETKDHYNTLSWSGGDPIPMAAHDRFELEKDNHINVYTNYHVNYLFRYRMEVKENSKKKV